MCERQSVLDASLSISTCIVTNDYIVRHETNAYFTGHFDKPRIYLYSVLATYENNKKEEEEEKKRDEKGKQIFRIELISFRRCTKPNPLPLSLTDDRKRRGRGGRDETRKRYNCIQTPATQIENEQLVLLIPCQ